MRVLLILVSIIALMSCDSLDVKQMTAKTDSLHVILMQAQTVMNELDTVKPKVYMAEITERLAAIQELGDTANKEETIFLANVYTAKKSIKKMSKRYSTIHAELTYSIKQLNDLNVDISNGLILRNHFEQIYKSESKAISSLLESVNNLAIWHHSALGNYETLQVKLTAYEKEKGA